MRAGVTGAFVAVLIVVFSATIVQAGAEVKSDWISAAGRVFGIGGSSSQPQSSEDALEAARALAQRRMARPPSLALAASVSGEGHWTFINPAGQRYTAATPDEINQVRLSLGAEADGTSPTTSGALLIYVPAASAFTHPEHLARLPTDARLRIVFRDESYPLRTFGQESKSVWFAQVRGNILVPVRNKAIFAETVWQLRQSIQASQGRILALDPEGDDTLRPKPVTSRDQLSDTISIVAIKPVRVARALRSIPQQTAVLVGRVNGIDELTYRAPSGREEVLDLGPIRKAAAAHDVNLIIVNALAPRQPGARNWLWLQVEVNNLSDALAQETLGSFLNAIAGGGSQLIVEAHARTPERTRLRVIPMQSGVARDTPGMFDTVLAELVSEVVGSVVPHALDGDLVSAQRQKELDRRLLAWLPSRVQYAGLLLGVLGLLGLPVAWRWWGSVWAPERASDYAGTGGFWAAGITRLMVFVFLFLPLVSIPAIVVGAVRCIGWLSERRWGPTDNAAR